MKTYSRRGLFGAVAATLGALVAVPLTTALEKAGNRRIAARPVGPDTLGLAVGRTRPLGSLVRGERRLQGYAAGEGQAVAVAPMEAIPLRGVAHIRISAIDADGRETRRHEIPTAAWTETPGLAG